VSPAEKAIPPMPPEDDLPPDAPSDPEAGLPPWAGAIAGRLDFFARRGRNRRTATRALTTVLAATRERAAAPGGSDRLLQGFLRACLALLADAASTRPDLADIRGELEVLIGLARTALDNDCDDRPVLIRSKATMDLPGVPGWAARVPGRVVWLAAMAAQVPGEERGAAAMLVNDLAAVGPDLPLRALQAAVAA
jgi:hypothetical protein